MVTKKRYTSPDYLIHPGETLAEILEEKGYSQQELAIRTGVTPKHISNVINGKSNITSEFAINLALALDGDHSFWINLQANYDYEKYIFQQIDSITNDEKKIGSEIKNAVEEIEQTRLSKDENDSILELRQILDINNLTAINNLNYGYYRKRPDISTNQTIMFVWQYLCEKAVEDQNVDKLDTKRLKSRLPNIKDIMHEDDEKQFSLIQSELNSCGIKFIVNKHVKKAPIHGLTVKTKKGNPMIALTTREKFHDVFWFTLFHEIAHILNDEYDGKINNDAINNIENSADRFARDTLIPKDEYAHFVRQRQFSDEAISNFARKIKVIKGIVYGRLMKDKYIPWTRSNFRTRYEWK